VQPLKPPNPNFDNIQASLAAELATKLLPLADIMERYSLDATQLRHLMADTQFKQMIVEYRREWNSPLSARERVRMKSALAVEDGIPELHNIFYNTETNPTARLAAYKQLVDLAEMQPRREDAPTGPAFSLTLNLGGETAPLTLEHAPDQQQLIEVEASENE
jgi:hypothetical protein